MGPALQPIIGKKYQIDVRNEDDSRSTLIAEYVGNKVWSYGIGSQTRRCIRVIRRVHWYTGHSSNIIAAMSMLISLIALGVSIWK